MVQLILTCCRFWDVTEIIFRVQVGGETEGGKLLLEAMKQHIAIEDGIPLVSIPLWSHGIY